MAEAYLGEIRAVGFTFAPRGWLQCSGQTLSISDYSTLFGLIGTTYGGDGQTTFCLPDLRGRGAAHVGKSLTFGALTGVESVALVASNLPIHTHSIATQSGTGNAGTPAGNYLAGSAPQYGPASSSTAITGAMLAPPSGAASQPHSNLMPFLTMIYIICYEGIYPSS